MISRRCSPVVTCMFLSIAALSLGQTSSSQPVKTVPHPKPVAVHLPDKTPYDQDTAAKKMYLSGYRDGYEWATQPERHDHCLTNPNERNQPTIRGIIEGWQAGAQANPIVGGDLPAKYARYIQWNPPKAE